MATIRRHAFLTPSHNGWFIWTRDGSQTLTNPGESHRALESLAYAIDVMAQQGWTVRTMFLDQQGVPNLVFLDAMTTTSE